MPTTILTLKITKNIYIPKPKDDDVPADAAAVKKREVNVIKGKKIELPRVDLHSDHPWSLTDTHSPDLCILSQLVTRALVHFR